MSTFDETSYRTGVFVGNIIGSLMNGCRSMAGTWPQDALPEHKEQVEQIANMMGLVAVFDGRSLTVSEPEKRPKPDLRVIN